MDNFSGRQVAAARALLGISQAYLAEAANISTPTVKRMEGAGDSMSGLKNNVAAVRSALEAMGIEFLNHGSPGVRMRRRSADGDQPKSKGPATDVIERMETEIAEDRAKREG